MFLEYGIYLELSDKSTFFYMGIFKFVFLYSIVKGFIKAELLKPK